MKLRGRRILSLALVHLALVLPVASAPSAADDASEARPMRSEEESGEEPRPERHTPPPGGAGGGECRVRLEEIPVFPPPGRGAPRSTVGVATRGDRSEVWLRALAPDTAGRTLREQPTLFWYLSSDVEGPAAFTVIAEAAGATPSVDAVLPGTFRRGIHRIRAADHDLELEIGTTYHWQVSLDPTPGTPHGTVVTGGGIERVEPDPVLRSALASSPPNRRAFVLAEAAIWYDALAAISRQIDESEAATEAIQQRAALLEQVGMHAVAARELSDAGLCVGEASGSGR